MPNQVRHAEHLDAARGTPRHSANRGAMERRNRSALRDGAAVPGRTDVRRTSRGKPGRLSVAMFALGLGVTSIVASVATTSNGAAPVPPSRATAAAAATPGQGIALGAYVQAVPDSAVPWGWIGQMEASIGHPLALQESFSDWETAAGTPTPFPMKFVNYVSGLGAAPIITWQPQQYGTVNLTGSALQTAEAPFALSQIIAGRWDPYIRSWADQARGYGKLVYVRLMHEMNGSWYPWGNGVNGNTGPAQYVAAWQHVVDLFRAEGAGNVEFIWCGSTAAPTNPALFYPGDNYVSWIALDGYNRSSTWKSFTSIFATAYTQITAVSTRPVMIAEMASQEDPTNPTRKAAWITSAYTQEIPFLFPRVRAALYFDGQGSGYSYPLTSSPAALSAFAQVAAAPLYQAPAS